MKIAMLTNNYRPFVGGVPISVERQAQELVKLGHQVTVFAPMYESDEKEQNERLQKEIQAEDERLLERVIRYHSQKKKMDNGMVYPGIYPAEIFDVFERERFDYIHVHHPMFVGRGRCGWEESTAYQSSIHTIRDMKIICIIFRASGSERKALL